MLVDSVNVTHSKQLNFSSGFSDSIPPLLLRCSFRNLDKEPTSSIEPTARHVSTFNSSSAASPSIPASDASLLKFPSLRHLRRITDLKPRRFSTGALRIARDSRL